jgi:hypothetical protein
MSAQLAMPCALEKMLEHMNLNIEKSFRLMPDRIEDAMLKCLRCEAVHICEDDVESRYFTCPNRNLLDQLERLQGNV